MRTRLKEVDESGGSRLRPCQYIYRDGQDPMHWVGPLVSMLTDAAMRRPGEKKRRVFLGCNGPANSVQPFTKPDQRPEPGHQRGWAA